ncbi:MAG: hypothetical protein WAK16_06655 [Candidatus Cybelea sp.]
MAACAGPGNVSSSPGGAFAPAQARSKHMVYAVHPETNSGFVHAMRVTKYTDYDSIVTLIRNKVSSNISSEGFGCCSTKEIGDGLVFTHGANKLKRVAVVMNSFGCESGHWNSDDCQSTPGDTFPVPITLKVYAVANQSSALASPGAVIATQTRTFNIPYRPSKDDVHCTGQNLGMFVGPVDKLCDNGLSDVIWFNFKPLNVALPAEAIVTVAYNTSDAGYNPIGQGAPCFTSPGGCGYDSLNVSADGDGGFVGTNVDPNGVFVNFGDPAFYCSGSGTGLILDSPCWTGYHPEIQVNASQQ